MKKWFTRIPVALIALMGAGCGEGLDYEEQPLEQELPALAVQEAALEESPSAEAHWGDAQERVRVRGCQYQLSVTTRFPPFPPRQFLTLERLPSPHCEAASALLEVGYTGRQPLVATRGGELVVAWTRRGTPSGTARAQVMVFHVSLEALSVKREVWLGHWEGEFTASAMRFEGHSLKLDTNWGVVTIPHFLTREEPPQGVPIPPWL